MVNILKFIGYTFTIILYVLMLLSAYGGNINPAKWALPSILKLTFPLFLIATIIIGAIWALLKDKLMTILGAVVILASAGAILSYSPINFINNTPTPSDHTFSFMSYNVYYGVDREKPELPYSRTMSYIINTDADIVCMQEQYALKTHVNPKFIDSQIDSLRQNYPYILERGNTDVMIMSKYPLKYVQIPDLPDLKHFTFDAYEADISGEKVTILNIHLSSYDLNHEEREIVDKIHDITDVKTSAKEFKHSIFSKLSSAFKIRAYAATIVREMIDKIEGNIIVCGDFNDVSDSWAYNTIKGDDLTDAYQEAGFGPIITYNAHHMYFHIDHILYRGMLKTLNFEKGGLKSSDHYPIFVKFALSKE